MAKKAKSSLLKQMEAGFSRTIAEEVCDWCLHTKGARDPWAEFIAADRLPNKLAYDSWTSDEATQFLNETWQRLTGGSGDPWADDASELARCQAAVDLIGGHFICTKEGGFSLYEVLDQDQHIVTPVIPDNALVQVGHRVREDLIALSGKPPTPARMSALYGYYSHNAVRQDKPVLLGRKGGTEWCLARAMIDPDPCMPFPHLRMFLDRLSDAEAFGAIIAGIYFGDYAGRQTLWISDVDGLSGKSSAMRVIATLFGDVIATALNAKLLENAHVSSHFVGKRLVVAGDNNNPALLLTGAFKEISGNDKVLVNPKFKTPHSTYLQCFVAVLSNVEPTILGATHSTSRILWLRLDQMPREQLDKDWERKAAAELPGFLAWCQECYAARCPDNFEVQVNAAVQDAVAQKVRESEDVYSIPFHKAFDYTGDPDDVVSGAEFLDAMAELKLSQIEIKNLKSWMDVNFDIARAKTREGYVYRGIKLRSGRERQRSGHRYDDLMEGLVEGDGFSMRGTYYAS